MSLNGNLRKSSATSPKSSCDPVRAVGREIVAKYARIEEAWKKAESRLALAHVPVDVQVRVGHSTIGDPEQPLGECTHFLAYRKTKNQWRICYVEESYIYGDDMHPWECRPITECSVETRLEMFDFFPKLLDEVVKVTKEFGPKIDDAVTQFEASLEAIDE